MTRDEKYLRLAQAVASIFSKDPSTQVGAVAVGERPNLVAHGYNGLPPGIADDERLLDRQWKYAHVLHAEENALANATFPVRTLYVTKPPCIGCALRILAARTVTRVVTLKNNDVRWIDSQQQAAALLTAAGVTITTTPWTPDDLLKPAGSFAAPASPATPSATTCANGCEPCALCAPPSAAGSLT